MLSCRVLGHRYRFTSSGRVMTWSCARGCGAEGRKVYDSAEDAARFARAFDKEDRGGAGRHATLTMAPLWVLRRLTGRSGRGTP